MKINRDLQDKAIAKELSSRFKQYRIAASMTRTELAEKSMVSVGTIARFENGSDIGLLNLIKLLKAVDLEEKLDLLIPDPQERPVLICFTAVTIRTGFLRSAGFIHERWRERK